MKKETPQKSEPYKQVIIVTDGDQAACKAVEVAATNIGGRCISASSGNPTSLSAQEIIELIKQTPCDPVLVMVDDEGNDKAGYGEAVLKELVQEKSVRVIGIVAVASDTKSQGIPVDYSVTFSGEIIKNAVNKEGLPKTPQTAFLQGDTVSILNQVNVPLIVGIGDPGKMDQNDDYTKGAPITTQALRLIMEHSK